MISCESSETVEVYKLNSEVIYRVYDVSVEAHRYLFYQDLKDSLVYRDFYLEEDDSGAVYYQNAHRKNKTKIFNFRKLGEAFLLPSELLTYHNYQTNRAYYAYHNNFVENYRSMLHNVTLVKQNPDENIYKISLTLLDSTIVPEPHATIINSCNIYWSSKEKFVGIDHPIYNTGGIKVPPRNKYLIKEGYEYLLNKH